MVFDKTGTLTTCQLRVAAVSSWLANLSTSELLALAGSAEATSEHPLGIVIHAHARDAGTGCVSIDIVIDIDVYLNVYLCVCMGGGVNPNNYTAAFLAASPAL